MKEQKYDNVWDALEDTQEAAENMKLRSRLMAVVQEYVAELDTTQTEASRRLGITQPRLNDLLQGKIDKFSLDALVNMLSHAGKHLSIRVEDAA